VQSDIGPLAVIPLWILQHKDISSSAVRFWGLCKIIYADQPHLPPSRAELAGDLGTSVFNLDRWFRELKKAGALRSVAASPSDDIDHMYILSEVNPDHAPVQLKVTASARAIALVEDEKQTLIRREGTVRVSLRTIKYVRFSQFWKSYPRKRNKTVAKAWWLKHDVENDNVLFGTIMEGLKRYRKAWIEEQTKAKMIPYPSTFLQREQYRDEVESEATNHLSPQTQNIVSASHRFLSKHAK
jgi:hypothetical protein